MKVGGVLPLWEFDATYFPWGKPFKLLSDCLALKHFTHRAVFSKWIDKARIEAELCPEGTHCVNRTEGRSRLSASRASFKPSWFVCFLFSSVLQCLLLWLLGRRRGFWRQIALAESWLSTSVSGPHGSWSEAATDQMLAFLLISIQGSLSYAGLTRASGSCRLSGEHWETGLAWRKSSGNIHYLCW